jgi:predicted Zn-dependent protease
LWQNSKSKTGRKALPKYFTKQFILVLSTLFGCSFYGVSTASSAEFYKVNGKMVTKNVYEAANLINSANASYKGGFTDKAIAQLKMALTYSPNFAAAHANLGVMLARQGKNAEALEQLKQATECPDPPATSFGALASLYQATGKIDAAIETYKHYLGYTDSSEKKQAAQAIIELLEKERNRQKNSHGASETDYFVNAEGQFVTKAIWTRWHMPLKVYIDPNAKNVDSYSSSYDTLLRGAFSDWSEASHKQITFHFVDSEEESDIDCAWTDNPDLLGSGSEDGHCDILSSGGAMAHAKVKILCSSRDSFPLTENNILSTCRHEIGHALGIGWHSADPNDVMYYSAAFADREKQISKRDASTLLKLYATELPPAVAFADFMRCSDNRKKYFPLAFLAVLLLGFAYAIAKMARKEKSQKKLRKRSK